MRPVFLVVALLCAQGCAYETGEAWSTVDGAVDAPDAGGLVSLGALALGLDGAEARRLVSSKPSNEGSVPDAEGAAPRPPFFHELPSELEILAGTWYAERNEARFGAEAIHVRVRDRSRPSVEDLGPLDTLFVDIRSAGCFHGYDHGVVVRGGRRLRAEATRNYGNSSERAVAFTLTEDDVEALDDAFDHYRGRPGGGCTSYEMIHAVWRVHGQAPLVEYLYDDSCAAWDGTTTFVPLLNERLQGLPPGSLRRPRRWLTAVVDFFR